MNMLDKNIEVFFNSLFKETEGFIEIRMIKKERDGSGVCPNWYSGVDEFISDLPEIIRCSKEEKANAYFGVLPRREKGKGDSKSVLSGRAAWVDVDFKDERTHEAFEVKLREFSCQPSFIINSGHGRHLYWCMKEPVEPLILSDVSKRLTHYFGGDHTFDPPRVLRIPGSVNWKNYDKPVEAQIVSSNPEMVYLPSDFDFLPGTDEVVKADNSCERIVNFSETEMGFGVPESVMGLIKSNKKLGDLFLGKGKTTGDSTRSGYDFSLLKELMKRGITDPLTLAQTIYHRPDGEAKSKGMPYIAHTVQKVLNSINNSGEGPIDIHFEKIIIHETEPPYFEVYINGRKIEVDDVNVFLNRKKFKELIFANFHFIPKVPTNQEAWEAYINGILSNKDIVSEVEYDSAEVSEISIITEEVEQIIQDLRLGDKVEDLDRGLALDYKGSKCFKQITIIKYVSERYPQLKFQKKIPVILRRLGYESKIIDFDGIKTRVWIKREQDEGDV